ncbi:palmitoyltransferase erf2 [Lichtheimia corymbifera JMRC:FSU:9682]|uniref:Palmitoyltransferase n=1 Tax=Lichtheimia corymbifera JMRC:FSU:9682 TaxID=1263082 RepID=A0A068RV42_9FUNG|nr:palmitoyltransferase erf2 [Lichtheimia corymbifera JMRC:FSU:9682]
MQTCRPKHNVPMARPLHDESNGSRLSKMSPCGTLGRYAGNTRLICNGRWIIGPEQWPSLITLLLFIAPCVLFAIFTCPFLWHHVHPAVPIIFAYMAAIALASMLKTSFTDPGIIPRYLHASTVDAAAATTDPQGLHYREVQIKGRSWSLKYCDTCQIFRPPRASHCRQCDNCVECEDHHCIWLNNCIGKRNYRSFFAFITTCTLLCLYLVGCCIAHVLLSVPSSVHDRSFHDMFIHAPVSFCLAIVCFVLLWMVGSLTLFHCWLIARGVTTHEQLRARIMRARGYPSSSPYKSNNPLMNAVQAICQYRPISYIRTIQQGNRDI